MRPALAALLLSGCAASEYRMQRPDPCVCAVPCRGSETALSTWPAVHGVKISPPLLKRIEDHWGTPLESSFPAPVLSPADEVALAAWVDGVEPGVRDTLRSELDRERPRHVASVEHARLAWLDALEGRTLLPPVEAKLLLDQAIQSALDDEESFLRDRATALFVAKLAPFTFTYTVTLDSERITEGTLVEPIIVREISRVRIAGLAKNTREAYAAARSSILAEKLVEEEPPRWAWARKKP